MSRKDIVLIATGLRNEKPTLHASTAVRLQWEMDCKAVARACADSGHSFNIEMFLAACGVPEVTGGATRERQVSE